MSHKYNLIIFCTPQQQQVSDFITVRHMMYGRAEDIAVHIIGGDSAVPEDFWLNAARLPTLIFAPAPIKIPRSIRGTRIIPVVMSKTEEVNAIVAAGFPVPASAPIKRDTRLDEGLWGPFTVVKPNYGHQGDGVRLVRTRDVRWIDPMSWPKGDPRHGRGLLAQKFINTGSHARSHRVFTVLGHAIYSRVSIATEEFVMPDPNGEDPVDLMIAANGGPRSIELSFDEDIVSLAEALHRKFPHLPTMGLDIVRDHETGELFVLEMNSRSYTWHLSSNYGLRHQRAHGMDYYGQFNALGTLTKAFIETTRQMAS